MARRLIHTESQGDRIAKVYRDAEWEEYRVRLFENGVLYSPADYFTDDKSDAIGTAKLMTNPI